MIKGLIKKLLGEKALSATNIFGGLLSQGLEISKFSSYQDFLTVGSKKVWASFKACDLVAKVLLDTEWEIVRGESGRDVANTEVERLLKNPNRMQTLSELLYLFVFHMKLTGNAYWVKDSANINGDKPKALYPINPKRVQLVIDPRLGVTGYIYNLNGLQIPFEINEVMHFKNPHPDNDFYGIGDIEAGTTLFNDQVNRDTWSSNFWKNGASPSGVLVAKDLFRSQAEFDIAKKKWSKEYGGGSNSGKTAWLTGDWSYVKLGLSSQEMQNIEASKLNVENIFHLHGVPLSVAGIKASANYATARVEDLIFRRYTIKPLVKLLEETLQSDLVDGYGGSLSIKFDITGLIDLDEVINNYIPLFDRGALSVNELRSAAGFTTLEDPIYDQHFMNAGLTPLEISGLAEDSQTREEARRAVTDFMKRGLNGASRRDPQD